MVKSAMRIKKYDKFLPKKLGADLFTYLLRKGPTSTKEIIIDLDEDAKKISRKIELNNKLIASGILPEEKEYVIKDELITLKRSFKKLQSKWIGRLKNLKESGLVDYQKRRWIAVDDIQYRTAEGLDFIFGPSSKVSKIMCGLGKIVDLSYQIYPGMTLYRGATEPKIEARILPTGFIATTISNLSLHLGTHIDGRGSINWFGRNLSEGLERRGINVQQTPRDDEKLFDIQIKKGVLVDLTYKKEAFSKFSTGHYLKIRHNKDYETILNILRINVDELKNSNINEDEIVVFYTGWGEYRKDINLDTSFEMVHPYLTHPYLSEDVALWLTEKKVWGIGIDTISVENPIYFMRPQYAPDQLKEFIKSKKFEYSHPLIVHGIFLGNSCQIIEVLNNLDILFEATNKGEKEFYILIFPLPVQCRDAALIRAAAIIPKYAMESRSVHSSTFS